MTDLAPQEPSSAPAMFKKRMNKTNFRKRPAIKPSAGNGSESESEQSFEDEADKRVKRRRNNGVTVTSAKSTGEDIDGLRATQYAADKSAVIDVVDDATRQSNWYEANAKTSLSEKELLGNSRTKQKDTLSDIIGTYRGAANYQSFIQKNPNAPNKQVGPIKAPTNVRTITVTDFAPDVCKDYKQTGWCGFGDSCKFLHAREDYKQGWELDRDWEIGTKGKKIEGRTIASANRSANLDDEDDDAEDALLESIPFACVICKKPYQIPIVTKCGHYFCEMCALQRYRKTPSCAICGAGTGGVFNGAKNLRKLLEKKKRREKERRERDDEGSEDVSADERGGNESDVSE